MAFLSTLTQTLPQIQTTILESYNSTATVPAATGSGSALGPSFNAVALAIFNQQQQVLYTANISRLSTVPVNADGTPNPDVDSFCAPFGVTRLLATASQGYVVFSAASPVQVQVVIPVGAVVQTSGGLQFSVIADTTQPGYSVPLNGYVIPFNSQAVTGTVQCTASGTIGNVQANQITQIFNGIGAIPLPAIQTVNNPYAFTDIAHNQVPARDVESDAALKTRFTLAMSTSSPGTTPVSQSNPSGTIGGGASGCVNSVAAAILGVQTGITYSIGDRKDADGSPHVAYFTAVVAFLGATTSTPSNLITQVTTALEGNPAAVPPIPQARPDGIDYQVIGPTIVTVDIGATITMTPGSIAATVQAAVIAAFNAYISTIGLDPKGSSTIAQYGKVYAVLYGVTGVAKVEGLTLNSGTSDITAAFAHMLAPGTNPSVIVS